MTYAQKKSVNLSIDAELVAKAKDLGLNLSRISTDAIAEAVRREAARKWQEENAEAIAAYNARIDAEGTLSDHIPGWWNNYGAV
jgi:antitoxin CcdA